MTLIKILLPVVTASMVCAAPISSTYQQKCASCHGFKGEKEAMTKSNPIKGMAVAKIEKTLHDYASGERKAIPVVKSIKKNFLDTNSKEQVRALAEYISAL
jgi:cytochrome c553